MPGETGVHLPYSREGESYQETGWMTDGSI